MSLCHRQRNSGFSLLSPAGLIERYSATPSSRPSLTAKAMSLCRCCRWAKLINWSRDMTPLQSLWEDYNDTYAEFSIIHSRPEFRRQAFDLITSVLGPEAQKVLVDYRPLIANFVNKLPGTGVVPTHQNLSVVDESQYASVSVWVALVDCVLDNGAMSLLEGSHRSLRSRRGMWAYQAFGGIEQGIIDELLTRVEVPAGHAVILDDALVHYSPPNQTDHRRLAIQLVMAPQEVKTLWHQQIGTNEDGLDVQVWEIDERFFFEFWHGDGDDRYGQKVDRITVPSVSLAIEDLQGLLGS